MDATPLLPALPAAVLTRKAKRKSIVMEELPTTKMDTDDGSDWEKSQAKTSSRKKRRPGNATPTPSTSVIATRSPPPQILVAESPLKLSTKVLEPATPAAPAQGEAPTENVADDADLDGDFLTSKRITELRKKGKAKAYTPTPTPPPDSPLEDWVLFKEDPIFFDSYMEPFIYVDDLETIIKGYQVLAACFGRKGNVAKRSIMKEAAEEVLKRSDVKVTALAYENPWALIELSSEAERTTLLSLTAIGSVLRGTIVFIRPVWKRPQLHRLVQVLRVKRIETALDEVVRAANERWSGVELSAEFCPPTNDTVGNTTGVVFLKVSHTSRERAEVFRPKGQLRGSLQGIPVTWETRGAPTCQFCHGSDHLHWMCEWFAKAGAHGIEVDVALGEENRPKRRPRKTLHLSAG